MAREFGPGVRDSRSGSPRCRSVHNPFHPSAACSYRVRSTSRCDCERASRGGVHVPRRERVVISGDLSVTKFLTPTGSKGFEVAMAATRVQAIFASEAPVGLVFCRGPSDWWQLFLWKTRRDEFEAGAWFRGVLRPQLCDLSSDGKLFVYAATKFRRSKGEPPRSWTAVSRPPWISPLVAWENCGSWTGGGKFTSNRRLLVDAEGPVQRGSVGCLEVEYGDAPMHQPRNPAAATEDGADWISRDPSDSIVFSRGGALYRRSSIGVRLIREFPEKIPDPRPPPSHATHW